MSSTSLYTQQAYEAAARFIKNVVVLDDEAHYGQTSSETHALDAEVLTEAFAKHDILCSVIAPRLKGLPSQAVRELVERYTKLILTADAAILDWQMSKETGDRSSFCKELIKNIVTQEYDKVPRVLVIYTGENVTPEIVQDLKRYLPASIQNKIKYNSDELKLSINRLEIVFLQKPQTSEQSEAVSGLLPPKIKAVDTLPDEIITYYALHTQGILPGTVFNALSAVRENTNQLLAAFHAGLDSAFMQHMLLQDDRGDGLEFLVNQITDELDAIISSDQRTAIIVSSEFLTEWWEQADASFLKTVFLDKEQYEARLGCNGNNSIELSKDQRKALYATSDKSLLEFSRIADLSIEADALNRVKMTAELHLTFGSLVCSSELTYYICIMPACDSVRLIDATEFPFLALSRVDNINKCHVHCFDSTDIYCEIPSTKNIWSHIVTHKFPQNKKKKRVVATKADDGKYYFSTADEKKFRWIANIKSSTMLDIHKKVFPMISRIGGDSYEWIRNKRG